LSFVLVTVRMLACTATLTAQTKLKPIAAALVFIMIPGR